MAATESHINGNSISKAERDFFAQNAAEARKHLPPVKTPQQQKELYEAFLQAHPNIRFLTFIAMAESSEKVNLVLSKLLLWDGDGSANLIAQLMRDVFNLESGIKKLSSLGLTQDNLKRLNTAEKEDFLILAGKVSPLLAEHSSSDDLEKDYLTQEENQRFCASMRKSLTETEQADALLLKNGLWDNSANSTGYSLKCYRIGLKSIFGYINANGKRDGITITTFKQLRPDQQHALAISVGKIELENPNGQIGKGLYVVGANFNRDQAICKFFRSANSTSAPQPPRSTPVPSAYAPSIPSFPASKASGFVVVNGNPTPSQQPFTPTASPYSPQPGYASPAFGQNGLNAVYGNTNAPLQPAPAPQYIQPQPVGPQKQPAASPTFFAPPVARAQPRQQDVAVLQALGQEKAREMAKQLETKQKFVSLLNEYKSQIEADLAHEKEYDFFRFGVSKKWKKEAVRKVLEHLETNFSIENLGLTLADKEALEDGKLRDIVSQIPGYDEAIRKATDDPKKSTNRPQ